MNNSTPENNDTTSNDGQLTHRSVTLSSDERSNLMTTTAPTRRSVTTGAAWALPAITLAAAAPANASSCVPTTVTKDATINPGATFTSNSITYQADVSSTDPAPVGTTLRCAYGVTFYSNDDTPITTQAVTINDASNRVTINPSEVFDNVTGENHTETNADGEEVTYAYRHDLNSGYDVSLKVALSASDELIMLPGTFVTFDDASQSRINGYSASGENPQTITTSDPATCTTTITTVHVTGGDGANGSN